jgi:hypothetical protein
MNEKLKEAKKVQDDFQFIMRGALASGEISKVEFRKSEFKHFSTIDNSHFKSESLTKIK